VASGGSVQGMIEAMDKGYGRVAARREGYSGNTAPSRIWTTSRAFVKNVERDFGCIAEGN
jgi:hypothetical protein